jgi:hypothetical protein
MLNRAVAWTFTCLCVAMAATPAAAQWRRLDTPNFVVIGDVSAGELRSAGARFEGFREAVGSYLRNQLTTSVVPTVVVVFSSDGAFNPFKPRFQGKRVEVDGIFLPGRYVNYIALVNGHDEERQRVIMHEFAHLLVSNSGLDVPLWLNEGLAEYYSTLTITPAGTEAVVGGLIQNHLDRLNDTKLMPLEELLTMTHQSPLYNEGSRRSVFYAQSWALAHLLQNGKPDRSKALNAYLARASSGMPPLEAWKEAFGSADIMRELEQYIRRLLFTALRFKLSGKAANLSGVQAVEMPRTEADAYLGHVLVQLDELDDAAARFASVEKRDPANVRARVGAALLDQHRDRVAESATRLKGLAAPDDWFLAYLAGQATAALVEHSLLPPTADTSAAVRAMFTPAVQSGREFPAIAATMTQIEMSGSGRLSTETRAALERARTAAPGQVEFHLMYAQVLARDGDFAAAREVLGPLLTPRHPLRVRDVARRLMGILADAELGKAPATNRVEMPTGRETVDREPVTRPLYRETKPGETRIEGDLTAIECVTGKGITFHVKTTERVELFTVKTFDEVDFITYRDDLKGSIGCGPSKTAMPVLLTWRAGTSPDTRAPVAIEFLPVK